MGGTYADVPARRMAYDRDGTAVVTIDASNNITELTTTQKQQLNDEATTNGLIGSSSSIQKLAFVFPEARDIKAFFVCLASGTKGAAETSTNTTNGLDGTWSTITGQSTFSSSTVMNDDYRDSITDHADVTNIKGVRFNISSAACEFNGVHLFGDYNSATGNRLTLWDPTLNQIIDKAHFDFDDVTRSSNATIQFRVKNSASTLQANSIGISFEALTDASPTLGSQLSFSTDNSSFSSTINIGNLTAGSISAVLYVKRTTLSNGQLGLWAGRIIAKADSWT